MFAGLKRRRDEARDEARVDEVAEELADLLQQYGRLVPADRREVLTAFERTLSDFEQELGVCQEWSAEQKKGIAQAVSTACRQVFERPNNNLAVEMNRRIEAHGAGLFGLYIELKALPGNKAIELGKVVENWWRSAL